MTRAFLVLFTIAGIVGAPALARAQERLGDGALGAVAGALVAGPIGAVAGGVIGYTAGPGIAQSWGLKKRHHYTHASIHAANGASAHRVQPRNPPSTF